jgi:hypothetical protein
MRSRSRAFFAKKITHGANGNYFSVEHLLSLKHRADANIRRPTARASTDEFALKRFDYFRMGHRLTMARIPTKRRMCQKF